MPITAKPLIIFSHGNSFSASTYGVMVRSLESRGYQVRSVEKFGHDPAYPVSSNWPYLVQQLADFTAAQVQETGQPAFLVGHSLGGLLSIQCAARNPMLGGKQVRGVLLLDSPLIGGWRASGLKLAKRSGLVGSVSPGTVSRKRRNQWLGKDEALAHFSAKKVFAAWDQEVLRDYIEHGTHDAGDASEARRHLSFDRDVETAIYNQILAKTKAASAIIIGCDWIVVTCSIISATSACCEFARTIICSSIGVVVTCKNICTATFASTNGE